MAIAGCALSSERVSSPPWRADSSDPVERTRYVFRMERRPPSAVYGVFRADVLARTGLYRPTHGGDHIIMAEITLYGPVREVPERLFMNRWHSRSGSKIVAILKAGFTRPPR